MKGEVEETEMCEENLFTAQLYYEGSWAESKCWRITLIFRLCGANTFHTFSEPLDKGILNNEQVMFKSLWGLNQIPNTFSNKFIQE